jgi:hypothetical protein
MKIIHRVAFQGNQEIERKLLTLGINFKKTVLPGKSYLLHFDIDENNPEWKNIQRISRQYDASDIPRTVFTKKEVLQAEWLVLRLDHFSGYPHPEDTWREISGQSGCPVCNIGWKQTEPFQIAKSLTIGKRAFTSLYWAYPLLAIDEIFEKMAQSGINGYERRALISSRTGEPFIGIAQVFIPYVTHPGGIYSEVLDTEIFECGHQKYRSVKQGQLSVYKRALLLDVDFQYTYEWFGNEAKAYRELLVSHKIARLIIENKWKGVVLHPVRILD